MPHFPETSWKSFWLPKAAKPPDLRQRSLDFFSEKQIQVKSLTRKSEYKWYKKDICAIVELDFGKRQKHQEVLEEIGKIEGIRFIHEI